MFEGGVPKFWGNVIVFNDTNFVVVIVILMKVQKWALQNISPLDNAILRYLKLT